MKGQWFTGKSIDNPLVTFRVNSTTSMFLFEFRPGDGKANLSRIAVWSVINGVNTTQGREVVLRDLDPQLDTVEFNLTITCANFMSTGLFHVVLNYWDPSGDPRGIVRNATNWDIATPLSTSIAMADVAEVRVQGNMRLYYVGFTADQCLALAPNGLVTVLAGDACSPPRPAVCEYKACYTVDGKECVFPFYYKNVLHTQCTSEDVYLPWCPTQINASTSAILSWGLCLPDCNFEVAQVACLAPPPVPQFGARSSTGQIEQQNYLSDWFQLAFVNNTDGSLNHSAFLVTRARRKRLFQPLTLYHPADVDETNLSLVVRSRDDFFNDVYEIRPNGTNATYTCPLGWVFADSHNISQHAYCHNWAWRAEFDVTKACVRKLYRFCYIS
jgi:hypothetical protein